ncbi:hypothetical protein A9K58_12780 [Stenotrophomonas maltophilia]|uniref:Uncharacterized protein n=1 Tax=Stenotrophomonas maltophilia TaxID=40324 RepID=A0A1A6XTH8_STEMA|nr:hypothetical protein [Stenotrophomonas maltophilia]OBU66010.1 hypothetical protein A9K58_12780 [Stenotrophomonas maltophilia]
MDGIGVGAGAIEANIVNLLEPIESEPELFDSGLSDVEYIDAVNARLVQLRSICGNDGTSIWGGSPVDMNLQIELMRKSLAPSDCEEWIDRGGFLSWRRKFEVYSGVDCSGFYGEKGIFQPRAAAAILNRYSAAPLDFEVGRRYFFGQRVRQ